MENHIHDKVQELFGQLNCRINKVKIEKIRNAYRINLETSEPSLLIGHHGETIFALQHILRLLLWKNEEKAEVILDIDNYRKKQEDQVIQLAERKVDQVRKNGLPISLPPMSAYFRRVVHTHLVQDKFKDIKTESTGEGDQRCIVIKPQQITI